MRREVVGVLSRSEKKASFPPLVHNIYYFHSTATRATSLDSTFSIEYIYILEYYIWINHNINDADSPK